jgi:hypothetical protein
MTHVVRGVGPELAYRQTSLEGTWPLESLGRDCSWFFASSVSRTAGNSPLVTKQYMIYTITICPSYHKKLRINRLSRSQLRRTRHRVAWHKSTCLAHPFICSPPLQYGAILTLCSFQSFKARVSNKPSIVMHHTNVCMYVCMCVCMYVCMYV